MKDAVKIPEGMVPVMGGYQYRELVADVDLQRDDVVRGLFAEAMHLHEKLKEFKGRCTAAIAEHYALANDGETGENDLATTSLSTLDGSRKMDIEYAPVLETTEKIVLLQKLLKEALNELSGPEQKTVWAAVSAILQLDEGKQINLKLVERLGRHKLLTSESWKKAIALLPECTRQIGIHPYYRFRHVDTETGDAPMICLNFSRL